MLYKKSSRSSLLDSDIYGLLRFVGPLVCRTNGVSDQWCVGPMMCRTNGVSDQWCVGPMVCRTNGVSDQWCVGPMVSHRLTAIADGGHLTYKRLERAGKLTLGLLLAHL